MKEHFARLFNYDHHANLQMLNSITQTANHEKAEQLMAHLLAAQQIWLSRCNGEPAIGGALWPDWKADTFEQIINNNHQKWSAYLETLDGNDFNRLVNYKNSKGEGFENKLIDILTHLINHGTHHRAQAGQHLKLEGTALPVSDYIFYLRQL